MTDQKISFKIQRDFSVSKERGSETVVKSWPNVSLASRVMPGYMILDFQRNLSHSTTIVAGVGAFFPVHFHVVVLDVFHDALVSLVSDHFAAAKLI